MAGLSIPDRELERIENGEKSLPRFFGCPLVIYLIAAVCSFALIVMADGVGLNPWVDIPVALIGP